MEGVFFKYSEFYEDDGGFDQIRKDFDKLGDDLQRRAKDIKNNIQLFNIDDVDGIKQLESETESLTKAFKKYGDAKEDINKIEEAYNKEVKNINNANDEQIEKLTELDKKLQTYRQDLSDINKAAKNNTKTTVDLNKERVKAQLNIKNVSKEIRDQQKEILESNKLSKEQQKLLKAKITLEKEEVKTLTDVRERISALRVVVQSLDLETQADQISSFNDEINTLTDVLSQNSDKFIQNKINIGNYEESILNALNSTSLFTTNISFLDNALSNVFGVLLKNSEELEEMEKSLDNNSSALKKFTVSFGKLNKVLKASIIGAVIVAIAALSSLFGDTRAGAIRLEKVTSSLGTVLATLGQIARVVFSVIIDGWSLVFDTFKKLNPFELTKNLISGNFDIIKSSFKEVAENGADNFEKLKGSWDDLVSSFKNGFDAVVLGMENIERAFAIADEIKLAERNLSNMNTELALTQIISDDATRSLKTQLQANELALRQAVDIQKEEIRLSKLRLELINEKVKQNIKQNQVETGNIDLTSKGADFAEKTLELSIKRGAALEISNTLLDEQQEAYLELSNLEGDLLVIREENAKKQREIQRDIFEQNLDLLIDLIDTEKNLSEQFVNDVTRSFVSRINEFNSFLIKFRENSQNILKEFSKEANNLGLELDFEIEFDENGNFEVFIDDVKLATDNIVELNEQLQKTGLNEIDINRFREFIVETRNGVKDFKDLNKELRLVGINVRELSENISVSQDELNALDNLQEKIDKLVNTSRGNLSRSERESILKEIEELEKQKTAIEEFAEFQRLNNRKDAIDEELQTVEEESQRYYELLQERLDIEKQIRDKGVTDTINSEKEKNKKIIEEQKKAAEETRKIIDAVLDRALEAQQKRVEGAEERVDRQNELVDIQRQRAEQGLKNTLAFEQRELGKREAERIQEEKRQERLEKIRALYTSYSNYASRGDENPIVSALRDFAILETISASFGEGGVVEDKLPTNGIFRGRSHQGRQGGIPILVEGREGIFSGREMENLGKENFYKMKDLASMGKVDSNFFSRQRESFVSAIPVSNANPELISEMREVKKAIQSKPVQTWNASQIVNGTMDLVETILTKNQTKRNHYKTKKPRL